MKHLAEQNKTIRAENLAGCIGCRFTFRPLDPEDWNAKFQRDISVIEFELVVASSSHQSGLLYSRIDLVNSDMDACLSFTSGDDKYPDIPWPVAAVRVDDGFFITHMPMSVHGDDQLAEWAASQQHAGATLVAVGSQS